MWNFQTWIFSITFKRSNRYKIAEDRCRTNRATRPPLLLFRIQQKWAIREEFLEIQIFHQLIPSLYLEYFFIFCIQIHHRVGFKERAAKEIIHATHHIGQLYESDYKFHFYQSVLCYSLLDSSPRASFPIRALARFCRVVLRASLYTRVGMDTPYTQRETIRLEKWNCSRDWGYVFTRIKLVLINITNAY